MPKDPFSVYVRFREPEDKELFVRLQGYAKNQRRELGPFIVIALGEAFAEAGMSSEVGDGEKVG